MLFYYSLRKFYLFFKVWIDLELLHMKEKWIKATTRIIKYSTSRFNLQFIIYKDTKTKKMILYESNIMNWSSFRVVGIFKGTSV